MFHIRRSNERGHANHGWLDTHHTFSFAGYHDPKHMGFRVLRVINEDLIAPGGGFGTHPHRDMEIISYVVSGELEHKDSMGNGSIIKPGEVQIISAGSGITHSEFNPSDENDTHLYQIWILPREKGLTPRYEQKSFSFAEGESGMLKVASSNPEQGVLHLNQDVEIFRGILRAGNTLGITLGDNRYGWLQLVDGELSLAGESLGKGDGVAVSEETQVAVSSIKGAEFLFFDLP